MQCMLLAPLAVLLELESLGIILLILRGRIVAALAISARHRDQGTHLLSLWFIT